MRILRAAILGLVTLLAVVLLPSANASAAPTAAGVIHGYVYDAHCNAALTAHAASERGPPMADDRCTANDAVDHRSYGISARADAGASCSYTTCGISALLANVDNITGTTGDPTDRIGEALASLQQLQAAAEGASGAESALNGAQLSEHLAQLEKYGQAGARELESGRIRYYGDLSPANKPGEMVGRRLVREWGPSSGATRKRHETLDGNGTVRVVRPETGGPKIHYYFDEFGN